ncbi:MAG: pentapeptide repeat-containing protein [Alphaproteobacteria bacterium]|jgi:hypothetical protein
MAEENTPINSYSDLYVFVAKSLFKTLLNLLDSSDTFKKINARNALLKLEPESNEDAIRQQKSEIQPLYAELKQELEEALTKIIVNAQGLTRRKTNSDLVEQPLSLGKDSFTLNGGFYTPVLDKLFRKGVPEEVSKIIAEIIAEKGLDLYWSNFTKAELIEADFSGTRLRNAKFIEANLSGANFSGAELRWAKLSGIKGERADFSRANLYGADLYMANLGGADLRGAKFDEKTTLPDDLNTNSPLFPFSNKQINQLSESEKAKAIAFNTKFEEKKN